MEIRHLKMIKTVAATRNLTRAAEQLFLSQSALSHQLRELETELGAQLFVRTRRKMIITPAGERLLQTADHVLCEIEKAENAIANLVDEATGVLRLTTACYTCYHWLSPVLREYREQSPGVRVEIHPEATRQSLEHLLSGKLDLVLTSDRINDPNLEFRPIFTDNMVAVLAPDHPLAGKRILEAADFAEVSFIMYEMPDEESTVHREFFKPAGVLLRQIFKLPLTEAILEMVKAGMGVSIMAEWAVKPYLNRGEVISRSLSPQIHRTWYAVTLVNRKEAQFMGGFIDLLRKKIPADICFRAGQ